MHVTEFPLQYWSNTSSNSIIREMETKCREALSQIEEMQYAKPLEEDGYTPILKYAVCFFKKGCVVKKAE